jgi:hypothetical protein
MSTVEELGEKLHEALYNSKTKEQDIIDIIKSTDLLKRLSISHYYEAVYGKKLQDDLNSKLSSDFKNLVKNLFLTPTEIDVENIKNAFKGNSTDETILIEALTTKPKFMTDELKKSYKTLTKKELKDDIEKNFTSDTRLKKNLVTLLNATRSTNQKPNQSSCEKDAESLIKLKEDDWFNNEKIFENIFAKKSPEELVMIARYYYKKKGISLLDAIEKNATGKNKEILKEVFINTINPCELYAEKIYNAIKGLGTNDEDLIRVLTTRNDIDIDDIREMYNWKYKQNMLDDIAGDTSGVYQNLLLHLAEQ